jgi:hypothetical protein
LAFEFLENFRIQKPGIPKSYKNKERTFLNCKVDSRIDWKTVSYIEASHGRVLLIKRLGSPNGIDRNNLQIVESYPPSRVSSAFHRK